MNGWSNNNGNVDHCYKRFDDNVDWLEAVQLCREQGAILAEPRNVNELGFLSQLTHPT